MFSFQGARVHVSGRLMYGEITDQQGVSVFKNQIRSKTVFVISIKLLQIFFVRRSKKRQQLQQMRLSFWGSRTKTKIAIECWSVGGRRHQDQKKTKSQVQPMASSELRAAFGMDHWSLFLRIDLLLLVIFIQFYFHVPQHNWIYSKPVAKFMQKYGAQSCRQKTVDAISELVFVISCIIHLWEYKIINTKVLSKQYRYNSS